MGNKRLISVGKLVNKNTLASVAKLGGLAAAAVGLTGCLLTSPLHWEEFESREYPITFQAWTHDPNTPVVFECAEGSAYGPHNFEDAVWHEVTTRMPSLYVPIMDKSDDGSAIYSASAITRLPEQCWRYPGDYDGQYYSAIRVKQSGQASYHFNAEGLECLTTEVGKKRDWWAFLPAKCYFKYRSNGGIIPYIVVRTPH